MSKLSPDFATRMLRFTVLYCLFAVTPFSLTAQGTVEQLARSATELTLRFSLPDTAFPQGFSLAAFEEAGLTTIQTREGLIVPAAVYWIADDLAPIDIQVVSETMTRALTGEVVAWGDTLVDDASIMSSAPEIPDLPAAELRSLGQVAGSALHTLYFYPVKKAGSRKFFLRTEIIVKVRFEGPAALGKQMPLFKPEDWIGRKLEKKPRAAKPTTRSRLQSSVGDGTNRAQVKITTLEEGIYQISYDDLVEAGIELPPNLDPWDLRLTNKGRDVPFYVKGVEDREFDSGDYIEFFGEKHLAEPNPDAPDVYLDIYTVYNVYWLEWGTRPGQKMIEEEGLVLETDRRKYTPVYSFPHTVHYEKDVAFDRISQYLGKTPRDHWFLDWGIFSSEKKDYRIFLPDVDVQSDQPVTLRLMLHGKTFSREFPHEVEVFLNDQRVLNAKWYGQTLYDLKTDEQNIITSNFLKEDTRNIVTVINRAPRDVVDNFVVNWIEITYPRLLKAHKGALEFTVPENSSPGLFDFRITGFTSDQVSLYKLGVSKMLGMDVEGIRDLDGNETYELHFQDEVATTGVRYFAVEEKAKLKPIAIEPHDPVDLRNPEVPGNYIIVVPDSLAQFEAFERFVQHRENSGFSVVVASAEEVYNQFSHGIFSPHAIRDYFRYAYYNWGQKELFALLLGDGSYDNRDLRKRGTNHLPVVHRQMLKYGAAASDHWYSLMDDIDELPDIHLGRFPVNGETDLTNLIDKIIEYETVTAKEEWLKRFLLIGGSGWLFRHQSEILIRSTLPAYIEFKRLFTYLDRNLDVDPYYGDTEDLLRMFDEGLVLINFMGHGGGAIWADNGLFRIEDVEKLNNSGKYPFLTSMTCFTGAFDEPYRQTLSEETLAAERKGSIGVWASSGLGWAYNDFYIVRELFGLMKQYGNKLTIGQYLSLAKTLYISKNLSSTAFSILNQYNFLGDPGMRLLLPDPDVQISLDSQVHIKGDTVAVSAQTGISTGTALVEIIGEDRIAGSAVETPIVNGTISAKIPIAENTEGNLGWLRIYGNDSEKRVHVAGAAGLSFNGILFDGVTLKPNDPLLADSISIYAKVRHANPLRKAVAIVTLPSPDSLALTFDQETQQYTVIKAIPPLSRGDWLTLHFYFEDVQGNKLVTPAKSYIVPRGADLRLFEDRLTIAGDSTIFLRNFAYNLGDVDIANVIIRYEVQNADGMTWTWIADDTLDLPKKTRLPSSIPFLPDRRRFTVRVSIDPENQIYETDETNNQIIRSFRNNIYPISPDLGTTIQYTRTDTIEYADGVYMLVEPGTVSEMTTLHVEALDSIRITDQPDFILLRKGVSQAAWELSLGNEAVEAGTVKSHFWVDVDSAMRGGATFEQIALARWDDRLHKWIRLQTGENHRRLHALVPVPGQYAVFKIQDEIAPKAEINVEGQLFSAGGFVPAQPVISIQAQDANGVDISEEAIKIWIDGQELPYEQYSFVDSAAAINAVAVKIRPVLEPGQHEIRFLVTDAAGNRTLADPVPFKVADGDELLFLGTYPNPFETQTTFAYELSNHAEDLELKIYTTSGRLIRTISYADVVEDPNPLGPNYHEITWNARDEYGEHVANGMYYFKLIVKFRDKTVEKVGRIVRLR